VELTQVTESKNKIFLLIVMMTAFSIFTGCANKDSGDAVKLSDRVNTFKGSF